MKQRVEKQAPHGFKQKKSIPSISSLLLIASSSFTFLILFKSFADSCLSQKGDNVSIDPEIQN